jgi:very-short-patch-repair endonuclease
MKTKTQGLSLEVERMSDRGEVLVAIMNNKHDFTLLRQKQWYRIPISSVKKLIKDRWPPQWIAFYQTKVFGDEAFTVSYYAKVIQIKEVFRWQLFPDKPQNERSNRKYYQLLLDDIQKLPEPILSRRWRRIVFIPTTWTKFMSATEINDLYDDSPLEDRLWTEFKRYEIPAERQEFVTVKQNNYVLDFAIYCHRGNIDVETDGDSWHANPEKAAQDRFRDNNLGVAGWKVLRFGTKEIRERVKEYCIPTVAESINKLGGISEDHYIPRKINLDEQGIYQMGLFDD